MGLRAFEAAVEATVLAGEVEVEALAGWLLPPLILAQRALAASEIFWRVPALKVEIFFGTDAGLLPPLFFAAQRAFIKAESLALPAADKVDDFFAVGAEGFCAD